MVQTVGKECLFLLWRLIDETLQGVGCGFCSCPDCACVHVWWFTSTADSTKTPQYPTLKHVGRKPFLLWGGGLGALALW